MGKLFKILGPILIIIATVVAALTDVAVIDYTAIAIAALGLVTSIVAVWNKSEKKDWKVVLSVVLIVIGTIICGFAGITENVITQIITIVSALVLLILGIIINNKR